MIFHNIKSEDAIASLESNLAGGLSEKQAAEKLAQHGENRLREKKKKTNFQRFVDQFMQLLWINLVTDSLPAIALGMEAVEKDVMEQKPKPKDEGLFAHGFGVRTVLTGILFGAITLVAYNLGITSTGLEAGGQTLAFMVLALSQIVQAYNMRSEHSLFKIGVFSNKNLNWAALATVVLVALVMFTPLSSAFGLIRLTAAQYAEGLGLIFLPLLIFEIAKATGLIKAR